tara:strand:+ start:8302 stop:10422 length:2121 start_codon:yes stop_codon:yes gene_type:complete
VKLKLTPLFILFLSLNIYGDYRNYVYPDKNVSFNSFGQGGLIHLPTAYQKDEANIAFTFTRNEIWKLGTITVTPFNWLEASYFYYRPEDIYWGNKLGLYLDKGFNLKFSYQPKNKYAPRLAIGLDDFAGTGLFTREYFVSTWDLQYLKVTTGVGWGRYANKNTLSNPLSVLNDGFDYRPGTSSDYSLGGKPSADTWFRGDISPFGGIEYYVPNAKGLKVKVEYDPFDYLNFGLYDPIGISNKLRKKDYDINFGISIPYKQGNFDISYIKGNTFNFSFSIGLNLNKIPKNINRKDVIKKNYNGPIKKDNFYNDLLVNLKNNNIYLQTADINKDEVQLTIESPDLRNNITSSYRAARVTGEIANLHNYNFNRINVGHLLAGMQVNSISYLSDDVAPEGYSRLYELTRNTKIESPDPQKYKEHEFRPLVEFPVVFKNISPAIRNHIGSPEKFYYGGLSLSGAFEVQFSRNLIVSSVVGYSLFDNFDKKDYRPDSLLPNVRTDIVKYLQSDKYIEKLAIDYYSSTSKNIYTKFSFGILELMYAGYGAEILYKPFNKNFMVGYEAYKVNRRDYKLMAGVLDYKVTTDHLNLVYEFPSSGLRLKYSYGNYLARDKGYTIDFSRMSKSGFRAGFFFSQTDVPENIFGEGSFDKGFYFNFPTDLFFGERSKKSQKFGLRTMTRDGGQKLNIDNNLIDYIENGSSSSIKRGWYDF